MAKPLFALLLFPLHVCQANSHSHKCSTQDTMDHALLPHYQALRKNKSWRTILKLDQHAAVTERIDIIKKQFNKLSLEWHPDKPGGDKNIYQIVVAAYKNLTTEVQFQQQIEQITSLLQEERCYEVFEADPSVDINIIAGRYQDACNKCDAANEVANSLKLRSLLTVAWQYIHDQFTKRQGLAEAQARRARFNAQRQQSDANYWHRTNSAKDEEERRRKSEQEKEDLRRQVEIIQAQRAQLLAETEELQRRNDRLRRDEEQRQESRRRRLQAERQYQEDLNRRRLQAEKQYQEDLSRRRRQAEGQRPELRRRREREERRHPKHQRDSHDLHMRAQEQQDREEAEDQKEAEERKMAEEHSQRQTLHPAPASAPTSVNPTPPTSPNQEPENQAASSSSDKVRTGPRGRGTRAGTGRRRNKRKNVDPNDLILNIMGSDAEEEGEHAVGSEEDDSTLIAKKPEPCTMWQAAGCRRGEKCPYGHVGEGRLMSKSEAQRRDRRRKSARHKQE